MKHIYEIYTKNPDDLSIGGWDIKFIYASASTIKSFPLFDEIITIDDYPTFGSVDSQPKLINWV